MKFTAGLLIVLRAMAGPEGPARPQEWFGAPVLPDVFRSDDPRESPPPLGELTPQDPATPPAPPPDLGAPPEFSWGKGLGALDLQAWQQEDDLRVIREWAGDAFLGLPLLVPQLVLEAVLPRGLQVGPTTFLYRTSPASVPLVVVVLDQMLFHEAEFLARVRELSDDPGGPDDLTRGQRRVLRHSLMTGLRATYAMPGLTMALVLQTAADQGPAGLLLVPPLGAAVLFFKGIEQKVEIADHVKGRVRIAGGRDWLRGAWSDSAVPTFSFELKFCDLPVGILGSLELSSRGMAPAFIGIGTTLDAVEEVLGREARSRIPLD
jgi:hypothetical protein